MSILMSVCMFVCHFFFVCQTVSMCVSGLFVNV